MKKSHQIPFNHHFPMLFLCFSYGFPIFPQVFPWFSHGSHRTSPDILPRHDLLQRCLAAGALRDVAAQGQGDLGVPGLMGIQLLYIVEYISWAYSLIMFYIYIYIYTYVYIYICIYLSICRERERQIDRSINRQIDKSIDRSGWWFQLVGVSSPCIWETKKCSKPPIKDGINNHQIQYEYGYEQCMYMV